VQKPFVDLHKKRPRLGLLLAVSLGLVACKGEKEMDPVEPGPVPITPFTADPSEGVIRRLTQAQYKNSIRDIFGPDVVVAGAMEPDSAISGLLTVGASQTSISSWGVEQYERLSYKLTEQIFSNESIRNKLVPCASTPMFDEDCAKAFIASVGRKLWRRPLTDVEIAPYVNLSRTSVVALGHLDAGLQFPLASMLQSPNFLFRVELGETDPENSALLRYSNFEMAQRMSYFLWNSTPDEALLTAADQGELVTDTGLEKQLLRMLSADQAKEGIKNFFTELYELQHLDELTKDPNLFLHFSSELGPDAREETLRVIEDHIFTQDGDYRDLFTTQKTFINRRLAALYEVRAPARDGFTQFEFQKKDGRRGLLGHASLLSLHSHAVASSATLRGKFIRKTLLCGVVPPPPVNVDTALPEPSGNAITLKQRLGEHASSPACSFCHLLIDPIGLGLENFDGIGRFRTKEAGATIDPSGTLDMKPFADAWELSGVIRNHPQLPSCLVKNLYQYATGNVMGPGEQGQVNALSEMFQNDKYRIKELIKNIMMSSGFRLAKEASP
jgi:hypothetical protein